MKIYETQTLHGRLVTLTHAIDDAWEVQQTHSIQVLTPRDPRETVIGSGDGIHCKIPVAKPLAIKTADCLAVLIEGKDAVCFLHAGWRGLAQNIFEQEIILRLNPLRAYFSPCISGPCYEVSEDFTENFPNSDFFTRRDGKLTWSLENEAQGQLKRLFPSIMMTTSGLCTFTHASLHSYRRDKTNQRNWNIFYPGHL